MNKYTLLELKNLVKQMVAGENNCSMQSF